MEEVGGGRIRHGWLERREDVLCRSKWFVVDIDQIATRLR